jgi:cold shock protein
MEGADMGRVVQGEVIRFDPVKGYGFIAPRDGGDDVFLHVNDLLEDKHLIRPGVQVEYIAGEGERGPKASSVQLIGPTPRPPSDRVLFSTPAAPRVSPTPRPVADDLSDMADGIADLLSLADLHREVTEALLVADPSLTGRQILAIRDVFSRLGEKHGWIVT